MTNVNILRLSDRSPVVGRGDLIVGDEILVNALHYQVRATVVETGADTVAESDDSLWSLSFHDEHGWICQSGINKRAIGSIVMGAMPIPPPAEARWDRVVRRWNAKRIIA